MKVFENNTVLLLLFVAMTETVPETAPELIIRLPLVVTVIPRKVTLLLTGGSVLVTVTVAVVECESVPS